jgi:L-lactate dehydrogenase complex protein LldG
MSDARTVILDRVAAANGSPSSLDAAEQMWEQLPRDYRMTSREANKYLLQDRLQDYGATVTFCDPAQLSETLSAVLATAHAHRIGIPTGFDIGTLPSGFDFVVDNGMSGLDLDALDTVLTRCAVAIAGTGTLVLQSAADQGRRAFTLVPDVHICLVRSSDVVETVPQAFARLQPTATLPTTFVSGPSATADIEMTRIKGVHGPRFLHVILIEDTAGANSGNGKTIDNEEHFETETARDEKH